VQYQTQPQNIIPVENRDIIRQHLADALTAVDQPQTAASLGSTTGIVRRAFALLQNACSAATKGGAA
jgi:hypothetical protein